MAAAGTSRSKGIGCEAASASCADRGLRLRPGWRQHLLGITVDVHDLRRYEVRDEEGARCAELRVGRHDGTPAELERRVVDEPEHRLDFQQFVAGVQDGVFNESPHTGSIPPRAGRRADVTRDNSG